MAVFRDQPYSNYNFLVDLGTGVTEEVEGGFSEVVMPGASIETIEYRTGNQKTSEVTKLPGRTSYDNIILKRGIIGSLALYEWVDQARNGDLEARRNVTIHLQNESRSDIVMTWKLSNAFPAKYQFSDLEARGKEVAVELLELAYERLTIE